NDVIRPLHNEVVLAATLDSSPNWQAIDTISIRDSRVPKENKSPDNYDPSKMFPPEIGPRRHGDENITSLDWRYNVMKVIEQEGLERLLPPEEALLEATFHCDWNIHECRKRTSRR